MKKHSNLISFIFSSFAVLNAIAFLLIFPALFYLQIISSFNYKNLYSVIFVLILFAVLMIISYQTFYRGIELDDMEGRPTRYGPMSGGDREIFSLMSKPIAFVIQILSLLAQVLALIEIYK